MGVDMILVKKIIILSGELHGMVKLDKLGDNLTGNIMLNGNTVNNLNLVIYVKGVLNEIPLTSNNVAFRITNNIDIYSPITCIVLDKNLRNLSAGVNGKDKNFAKVLSEYQDFLRKSKPLELSEKINTVKVELVREKQTEQKFEEIKKLNANPDKIEKEKIMDVIVEAELIEDNIKSDTVFNKFEIKAKKEKQDMPFYMQVSEQLDDLFNSFPHEIELEEMVHYSKWVKVNYDSESFYFVGVISDDDIPIFICYGVPADKKATPPEEINNACEWLPKKTEDPDGAGYWMLYQDALTGATVTNN